MKIKNIFCAVIAALTLISALSSAVCAVTDAAQTTEAEDKLVPKGYELPEDENMSVRSRYALLYSEYDDRYLFSKNADELVEPASTTKIMVGVMIFEKFGNRLDTQITITKDLLEGKEGLSVYLEEGEILTMRQLLTILLMHGANDVSTILAHYYMRDVEHDGDDLEDFAKLMTKRAEQIGCKNTVYKNVSGLHASGVKTILQDIIKVAVHAASIPGFTEMTSTARLTIEKNGPTNARTVLSRNFLVSSYQTPQYKTSGVTGMNYGSTEEMKECLLVSAEYDGKKYFAIIMGGYTDVDETQIVYTDAKKLLEYARTGFTYIDVLKKGVIITQANVRFSSNTDVVTLVPAQTVSMYLPVGTDVKEEITFKTIVPEKTLDAPVAEGQRAGDIAVVYNGSEVCRVPLITSNSVAQSRILYMIDRTEQFVKQPLFIASVAAFAVLLVIYVIIKSIVEGQKKKRKRLR
ncbi:MAG: D-alanyl-D-alanine carboxypeptidase [Clostridia bacterium]|nr:D-alanyl-D-alanine carboxypeptidase [Clostridia bacterium]